MKKRILLVEDDAVLARALSDNFTYEGLEVRWVADGSRALDATQQFQPDLIVLDVMLPGVDGFAFCAELRDHGGRTPVIMLTARGQKADKLRGLALGADDYVTKPFDIDELLARVRAVLRRASRSVERLSLGPVTVDLGALHATRDTKPLQLTHREFAILQYLSERPHKVVHRNDLLREVWGYPEAPDTRSVDHAIARLRKKIEADPHRPRYIHTVHGDGYCLTPDERSHRSGVTIF